MNEKPYISRKEQAQLTKKKIFNTTLLLIKKKGYSKITIREICQNAQISIGTFYLYFTSKDEILLDIFGKIEYKENWKEIIDSTQTLEAQILQLMESFLENLTQMFDKELIQEIYRIYLTSDKEENSVKERPFFQTVYSVFISAGIADANELCRKIYIFVRGYIFQWLTYSDYPAEKMKEDCMKELGIYLRVQL
ncbi:MAG: TetR/AcrR family transcriptional regulator [Lachnospiraceae bacterium]